MYRNYEFDNLFMYSRSERGGAIPAAHMYNALYKELPKPYEGLTFRSYVKFNSIV